jgi:hypothetical protein
MKIIYKLEKNKLVKLAEDKIEKNDRAGISPFINPVMPHSMVMWGRIMRDVVKG